MIGSEKLNLIEIFSNSLLFKIIILFFCPPHIFSLSNHITYINRLKKMEFVVEKVAHFGKKNNIKLDKILRFFDYFLLISTILITFLFYYFKFKLLAILYPSIIAVIYYYLNYTHTSTNFLFLNSKKSFRNSNFIWWTKKIKFY